MFPAFIKARPTYKHSAERHQPVWRETGSGAQAASEEIRAILAEIERRITGTGMETA
jgi:chromosome partitioning protein